MGAIAGTLRSLPSHRPAGSIAAPGSTGTSATAARGSTAEPGGSAMAEPAGHGSIVAMAWRVLVPLKQPTIGKRRLLGATRDAADHAQLVHAMQLDTLDAVLALATHPLLAGLSVVAGPLDARLPVGIELLPDAGGGLNPALAAAAAELARRYPDAGVAALVGDLPALRPADLLAALSAATGHRRSFVRDLAGTGTTLLAVAAGQALDPRFGPDSASRHAESGAVELTAATSLRADVDSAEDLRFCLQLGTGLLTAQMLPDLV